VIMSEFESSVSQGTAGEVSEDAGGIKPGRAILITFVFYAVQFVLAVHIFFVAGIFHGATLEEVGPVSVIELQRNLIVPVSCVASAGAGLIAFAVTCGSLHGSIRSGSLRPVGWTRAPLRSLGISAILGLGLALFYVFVLIRLHPQPPGQSLSLMASAVESGGWQRVCWAVFVVAVAPPAEEFVFRGVLLSGLRRSMGVVLAGAVVTVLFVASHATEALGYWPAWVSIAFLCVLTITVRCTSQSLLPPLILHTIYNAALVVMVYLDIA
jgi:membrane protease YdiL (CAAX protease family)